VDMSTDMLRVLPVSRAVDRDPKERRSGQHHPRRVTPEPGCSPGGTPITQDG